MAIQIGAPPDAGFDNPVGMLRDCHRRILRFSSLLSRVAREARGSSLSKEHQAAVHAALEYFRTSAPIHSRDEEESLFPRLRGRVPGTVADTMAMLEQEHREAEELLNNINRLFRAWVAEFSLRDDEERNLVLCTERLEAQYRRHIQIEEEQVFTTADAVLSTDTQSLIGREFAARRQA